jgi:hypothetical protein
VSACCVESLIQEGSIWLGCQASLRRSCCPYWPAHHVQKSGALGPWTNAVWSIHPCGAVLSLVHPYLRMRKLLRRCVLLWWRRFESSGVVCHLFMWKGRAPLACTLEVLDSGVQEPSQWRACDVCHCTLSGGDPHSVAPSKAGNLVYRLVLGKSLCPMRCGPFPHLIPFR